MTRIPIKFRGVCQVFARIERTTKRLEMIDLLARLFAGVKRKGGRDELDKIVYLATGRLLPDWREAPKLGVADKTMVQVLSALTTASAETIRKILVRKGDLGEAAYYVLHPKSPYKRRWQSSLSRFIGGGGEGSPGEAREGRPGNGAGGVQGNDGLTVGELYEKLSAIAKIEGEGSQEAKLNEILLLLNDCSAVEAKYLVRIITSTLRLGIAEMSVLDALAQAFTGDKKNRPAIEKAFNVHPDLGLIAQKLCDHGLDGVSSIRVEVGVPVKMMLASRMNYREILPKLGGECVSEYKLDGERLQIHKDGDRVEIFSRRLIRITAQYPDVVEIARERVRVERAIVEGEVVAMDAFFEEMRPFQELSRRRRKRGVDAMAEEIPVAVFVFDVLHVDGEDVMDRPFLERRRVLEGIVVEGENFRLVTSRRVKTEEELVEFFSEARSAGTEGTMNKSIGPESVYKAGNRGFLWIKLKGLEEAKMEDTIDAVIVGANWGMGRRQGWYGRFLLAVFNDKTGNFESFTNIGTGFSDDDLQQFFELLDPLRVASKPNNVVCSSDPPDVWIAPEVVIEIAGDEITRSTKFDAGRAKLGDSGYSLRFPKFIRIRDEKAPEDATTTREVVAFYENQQ
ncbi:MAG: ATP-dependent DNA ligase [Promethearchaeota archaeon]